MKKYKINTQWKNIKKKIEKNNTKTLNNNTDRYEQHNTIDPNYIEIIDKKTNTKIYTINQIIETLNTLNENKNNITENYDQYQTEITNILYKHLQKYKPHTQEYNAIKKILKELNIDTENIP